MKNNIKLKKMTKERRAFGEQKLMIIKINTKSTNYYNVIEKQPRHMDEAHDYICTLCY